MSMALDLKPLAEKNLVKIMTIKSISNGARRVILHSKIGWRKSNKCRFGSQKLIWPRSIAHVTGKMRSSAVHLQKRV
jgi:hypothetical protein